MITDWLGLKTPLDLAAMTPVFTLTPMVPGEKTLIYIRHAVSARTCYQLLLGLAIRSATFRTCFQRGGMTTHCLDDCPTHLKEPPSQDDILNMVQVLN